MCRRCAAASTNVLWADLSKGWDAMFDDYTEKELARLVRHMRRTIELGATQRDRLRAG